MNWSLSNCSKRLEKNLQVGRFGGQTSLSGCEQAQISATWNLTIICFILPRKDIHVNETE